MPITSEIHVRGTGICKCTKKQIRSFKGNHECGMDINVCKERRGCLETVRNCQPAGTFNSRGHFSFWRGSLWMALGLPFCLEAQARAVAYG